MADASQVDPRAARKEKQNDLTTEPLPSIAGGVSFMLGLVSIPLLLLPPSALVTGFLAIAFGHISKAKIRKHPELGGESSATNGLLMGYLCFIAALVLLPSIRMQFALTQGLTRSFEGITVAEAGSPFEKIERSFLDSSALATGNDKDARDIATRLGESLSEKRDGWFVGPGPQAIRTLCQTGENGICVIIMIPDLADFEESARVGMLNLCWKESQRIAFGKLTPGDDFSVAVRDRLRYHSMEFGRATLSPDRIAQPDSTFIDATMLDPYFESKGNPDPEEEEDEERE